MLDKIKNYSIHDYNISEIYFGVCEITVYFQNALCSERSELATEGVQIGSGGFKINWMWGHTPE